MKKTLLTVTSALAVGIIYFAGCKKEPSETGKAELTSSNTSESALLGLGLSDKEEEAMNINFISKLMAGLPETSFSIEKVISNVEAYSNYRFSSEDKPFGATALDVVTIPVTGGKLLDGATTQALAKQIFQSSSEATSRIQTLKGTKATIAVDVNLVKATVNAEGLTTYELKVTSVVGEANSTITRGVCPDYNSAIGYGWYDQPSSSCGGPTDGSSKEMEYRLNNYDCHHIDGNRIGLYLQTTMSPGQIGGNIFSYYEADNGPFSECLTYNQMVNYTQVYDARGHSLKVSLFGSAAGNWDVRAYDVLPMASLCDPGCNSYLHQLTITYRRKPTLIDASKLPKLP